MNGQAKRYLSIGGVVAAGIVLLVSTGYYFGERSQKDPIQTTDEKLGTLPNTEQDSTSSDADVVPAPSLAAAASTALLPKGCVLSSLLTRIGPVYQITITNKGGTLCKNVSYTLYYPQEETYVSALPKPSASNYYWRVGSVKPAQVYAGAAVTVSGTGEGAELCAAADNGADSCVNVTSGTAGTSVPPAATTTTPVPSPAPAPAPAPTPATSAEYGIWVWDSAYAMTAAKQASVIDTAANGGFNVIYLTIDDYLTTADANKPAYAAALSSFISQANARGISVDSVSGWRDWAKTANRQKGYTLITFVDEFNKSHANKIRSFQYDVEPYLLPEYETNKSTVLTDFLTFIDESSTRLANVDVRFSVVIPHFYDKAQNWTPQISYGGQTASTYTHLLRILDKRPGGSILIMAYRNQAAGNDGSIQLSKVEVDEAQGHATKVLVAQETGNVEPSYVTFYGTSKATLATQVAAIRAAFAGNSGFGGISIHYLDPYAALK
jgi:hypothetical protein